MFGVWQYLGIKMKCLVFSIATVFIFGCTFKAGDSTGALMRPPAVSAPRSPMAEIETIHQAADECKDNGEEIQRNATMAAQATTVSAAAPALARINDA